MVCRVRPLDVTGSAPKGETADSKLAPPTEKCNVHTAEWESKRIAESLREEEESRKEEESRRKEEEESRKKEEESKKKEESEDEDD